MPASAHHGDDDTVTERPSQGRVIDLASRRRPALEPDTDTPPSGAPVEYLESPVLVAEFEKQTGGADAARQAAIITAVWEQAANAQGVSLADPTAAAMARAAATLMEQLVYQGLTIRHGDATRGIEANPDDGIDHTSSLMFMDLVRGLRVAADTLGVRDQERM